jgi:hypothetical protein
MTKGLRIYHGINLVACKHSEVAPQNANKRKFVPAWETKPETVAPRPDQAIKVKLFY